MCSHFAGHLLRGAVFSFDVGHSVLLRCISFGVRIICIDQHLRQQLSTGWCTENTSDVHLKVRKKDKCWHLNYTRLILNDFNSKKHELSCTLHGSCPIFQTISTGNIHTPLKSDSRLLPKRSVTFILLCHCQANFTVQISVFCLGRY